MLKDLSTKGYYVARNLLPPDLINEIRRDFSLSVESDFIRNKNYPIVPAGNNTDIQKTIDQIIDPLVSSIADMTLGMVYYSIKEGINFPWHQDYESYFLTYDHLNCLNIYIPIYKPDTALSNLCVMDFSKLEQYAPEASFLKGYGATKFTCVDDTTICKDENNGESCVISVNFDSIMDQPELAVGDALIMRGDCIHRTQDVLSERTAISIRRVLSSTLITKEQHTNLTGTNKMIRKNNPELTGALNQLFSIKDTWSMGEMLKHLNNR